MKKFALCLMVIFVTVAAPASAENKGFYVGGGVGKSTLDVRDFFPDLDDYRGRQSTFGFKLFGGYRFLDYLAVEAGYTDLGTHETWETASLMLRHRFEVGVNGWNAHAVGLLPLGTVDLFAKIGVIGWDANLKIGRYDGDETQTLSGTDATYGLGIGFNFKHLFVRGEIEWFSIADAESMFMVSVSLAYRF